MDDFTGIIIVFVVLLVIVIIVLFGVIVYGNRFNPTPGVSIHSGGGTVITGSFFIAPESNTSLGIGQVTFGGDVTYTSVVGTNKTVFTLEGPSNNVQFFTSNGQQLYSNGTAVLIGTPPANSNTQFNISGHFILIAGSETTGLTTTSLTENNIVILDDVTSAPFSTWTLVPT